MMLRKWVSIILRSLDGCTASRESTDKSHMVYVYR